MRSAAGRTLVVVGLLGAGCEMVTTEPSPAAVPARVLATPGVSPTVIDPAVFAAAVKLGVRQPDANQAVYELDAFLAALIVEDLASARPSLLLTPELADGVPLGYRVAGVREGSVYAALGLLDGDIVETINGFAPEGMQQAFTLLAGSERGAVLQVTRAGISAAREVRIAGGMAWSQVLVLRGGVAPPAPPEPGAEPVLPDMPSAPAPGQANGGVREPTAARPERPGDAAYRPPTGASPAKSTPAPTSAGSPIECGKDGSCTVARRDFDAMVADPSKLTRQVQVGEVKNGYRLSSVRAGSQVSQLGFRNGDVITAINGTRVDDQLGLLGLYAGLESTRTYNVSYERDGVKRMRTVKLRD